MNKEELYRLYVLEQKTLKEVASIAGVTATSVWRWLRRAGIPARSVAEARRTAKAPTYSPEGLASKRRQVEAMRGKIDQAARERHRQKMLGRTPPNKGKPMSEEQRQKLVQQRADPEYRRRQSERMRGERSPNWKGGVKPEDARRLDRVEWRRLRLVVYERDNWTCADCGCHCLNTKDSKNHPHRKIQAHHIIPRRYGGTDEMENLVTLCMSCHHKRDRLYKHEAAIQQGGCSAAVQV